jgi:hypothetical protein
VTEKYDTTSLDTAGNQFFAHSQQLGAALARLGSSLPNTTDMCGDDDQGHQFAAKFQPSADQLHRFLGLMVQGLDSAGQGLHTMASNIERADSASTAPGA